MLDYSVYIVIGFGVVFAYLFFFRIVKRFNLIDIPTQRSSHHRPIAKGAGFIFVCFIIVSNLLGYLKGWPTIGIVFAGIVGFTADRSLMPPVHRLILYAIAWVLVIVGHNFFGLHFSLVVLMVVAGLCWINVFNFMDGINGMMTLNAAVALLFFWMQPALNSFHPLIYVQILVLMGYAVLNLRTNALAFAGDVGSITLAFVLGLLMFTLVGSTGNILYVLFFLIYIIDTSYTLIFRILKHENLFLPHRLHLYQLLANERKIPHLTVALLYAALQAGINVLILYLISIQSNQILTTILISMCTLVGYHVIRNRIFLKIKGAEGK